MKDSRSFKHGRRLNCKYKMNHIELASSKGKKLEFTLTGAVTAS